MHAKGRDIRLVMMRGPAGKSLKDDHWAVGGNRTPFSRPTTACFGRMDALSIALQQSK